MIRFENVYKSYPGGFEAIKNLSFYLPEGQMAFLTGASGAGKSTVLKLIALIERCTRGQIIVNHQNLTRMPERQIPYLRRTLGIVFQNHKLLMDRNVFHNVALPLLIAGFPRSEIGRRVRAALDKVNLLSKEKCNPITLSGGEQQRVGIARAVVTRPSLIIADEPTGNLDPALAQEIMRLFEQFNQVGVGVLIVTHAQSLVDKLGYPVLRLENGSSSSDAMLQADSTVQFSYE